MRKLSYAAMAVLLAVLFFFPGAALSAWDCEDAIDDHQPEYLKTHKGTLVVKVSCTSDAGAGTYTITNPDATGAYLVAAETVPGAGGDAPSAPYTLTVKNKKNTTILTAPDRSVTANEIVVASQTIGGYVPMFQTKIASTSLGDGNKSVFYLYYEKP